MTAKTPRALQVLEGLLPSELRPLSINLLGSGREEKRSLESSVGGILRKSGGWSENLAAGQRDGLEDKLRRLREEKAEIDRRLRDIRESETHARSLAEGAYRGTAARIAEAVNRDREHYGWFKDLVPWDQGCPLPENALSAVLANLRRFTPEKRRELSLLLPGTDGLPSPEKFATLVKGEEQANKEISRLAETFEPDGSVVDHLLKIGVADIKVIGDSLLDFLNERRRLSALSLPWMGDALSDIANGNLPVWQELSRITRHVVVSVEKAVPLADDTVIEHPNGIHAKMLLEDACALKEHMKNGGKLGWGPFRPKAVKERAYLLKTVAVNGRPCSDLQRISTLAEALEVRIQCEKAWGFWAGRCPKANGPYALQVRALKVQCDAIDEALSLETLMERCREALKSCPALGEPRWTDESRIERWIASCRLAIAEHAKRGFAAELGKIEALAATSAAQDSAHPLAKELLQAIRSRDVHGFANAEGRIRQLEKEAGNLRKLEKYIEKLRTIVPELMDELESTHDDPCWDLRIPGVRKAWNWARARSWIEDYIRKEDTPGLFKRTRQIEDEINDTIGKLASNHGWSFCFSRLKEDHRQHMEAWQQSMRRLGKGTGKHAPWHRRQAQKHLNKCREAVPAWVMPLHRVWDTVDPAPGMFDVIIVDEASQCGFEALPLFYLGRKVVIVGDDKQISPDAVGLPRDTVHQLMEQLLPDFEFKASFDIASSLFDHGRLLFGTRCITLREHFRCMPEIIRFSNDLCYSDTPLIPLRQYGPDRLNPLERVFIKEGYREGRNNRVINRPEAQAIADKIAELCKDPRYTDKTMGVVVLQGEAQAGLIEERLLEHLGAEEVEKRRLLCGNPYSFQGDERHVMFLSMVAAPNEKIGTLAKAADERRFNVGASRARDQMWLFHSVTLEDLSPFCLRRKLIEFFEDTGPAPPGIDHEELERRALRDNRGVVGPPVPFDSWFEVDVALEMLRKGFNVLPQYEVAQKRIDLVVEGGRARLAVECYGDRWHGADRYEADMQRQRMLERCGWELFIVRECHFYADKDKALDALWEVLEERGIHPRTPH